MVQSFCSGDFLTAEVFGKETKLQVFSIGENCFDENGDYKEDGFAFTQEEVDCLNWLLENVRVEDYREEITVYCNERYENIGGERITAEELEKEVEITTIIVKIGGITQSGDGSCIYPEISFLGECGCDPEHGICIGFRDKKFLGIDVQGWTL